MPESSAVDAALTAKLLSDPTLMAIATDGVYFDEAAPNATRFIVLSLIDEHDEPMFGGRAYEDALYLVKLVALSTSGADVRAGAARINTLLDYGTVTVTGYSLMTLRREARVRYTEVDGVDRSIRWQHRGGHYRVQVSPQ
jgi:hypothetical protein